MKCAKKVINPSDLEMLSLANKLSVKRMINKKFLSFSYTLSNPFENYLLEYKSFSTYLWTEYGIIQIQIPHVCSS